LPVPCAIRPQSLTGIKADALRYCASSSMPPIPPTDPARKPPICYRSPAGREMRPKAVGARLSGATALDAAGRR
jgi:hypothetical protein